MCLPHAGAVPGMFVPWADNLGPDVDLVSARYSTPDDVPGSVADLADRIAGELERLPRRPTTLFGHSMGGIVAYEVARRCSARAGLVRLVVSGTVSPTAHLPGGTHLLDDAAFVAEVLALGGTAPELFADPASRAVWLPPIRQDFRLIDTYRHRSGPPLSCPVTTMAGQHDHEAPPDLMRPWRDITSADFDLRVFPGGHFYLLDARHAVVAELRRRLERPSAMPSSLALP
ncbi:thioesterase II family protein [Streptomyces sp. LaPpAH-108]|uniref:thioesterase II family protein n=1 Tax=Streptomyces sp. LaPpAH-108 TaxID=1155714 RepID=UPI00039C17AD|nr:alpha/beta fold hydrolase [Streptomyces sp. LaPpAH-108]